MPRPLTPQSKLSKSTARLSQYLAENEISRTEIAKALEMSVSGLNSIFHRGVELSVVQAKAIEQEYGISEKWILKGEEPKMVNPRDKLNLGDRWLLQATSPDSMRDYRSMVKWTMELTEEHFKLEVQKWMGVLFMKTLDGNEELISGLKYWSKNIHDLLHAEYKKLKEDLPVKNVSDEERYRLILEGADLPDMKQWQTMRYYLMDLTTPNEQMLLSSEAASLKIDIDLSWINDHREKFLRPWKDLLHSVEQKLNEMKDDSNSASI